MRLVDPADGERFCDIAVSPLAGCRVFLIERTLMLVYHDAVFL